MSDFTRINQPRVEAINATLAMIHKSAHSNKISDDDLRTLLAPVAVPRPSRPATEVEAKPRPVWRDPPHQDRIGRFVADVPRDHVEIYITHLVARLCEMAKQKEPTP